MNQQELKNILELHKKWVLGEGGSRADLSSANLRSANLRYADLSSADLRSANLSSADLSYADLRSADLRYADLRYAKFEEIIKDFYKVLDLAKNEVTGLYKALIDGKIDGTQYQGECACLVGTIANMRKEHFQELGTLKPNSERASEKWFLGISKGDTPENNQVSRLTSEWTEAWMKKNGIEIPTRKIIWSDEK